MTDARDTKKTIWELSRELSKERFEELFPPGLIEGLAAWNAAGRPGPIHLPIDVGNTPNHIATPSAPDNETPVAGMGAIVSTLQELNAIDMVTSYLLHVIFYN